MSQAQPQPRERTRVYFSEESIRRREFVSRLFRGFALCATFFGLAMLLIFLTRLTIDVVIWFQKTPVAVREQNAKIEHARAELADAEKALADKLVQIQRAMETDPELKGAVGAEREQILKEYEDAKRRAPLDMEKTIAEKRREANADYRSDTSPTGILWHFVTSGQAPENRPQDAGIFYGLLGTLALLLITVIVAVPVGVGAAIYLEEYRSTSKLAQLIQININNMAGVPSVMFGILGAFLFVDAIFRPIETEMERPARIVQYEQEYQKMRAEGKLTQDANGDVKRMVALVNDPTSQLEDIRVKYELLVGEGKAPPQVQSVSQQIRAVLDPTGQLAEFVKRYDALVAEKKIKDLAKSDLDIPEKVLEAEGKSAEEARKATEWVKPIREAELKAMRIAVDQRLLSPPNYFIQAMASLFSTLGISVAARNVLGGGLTLALLVLPIVIVASQEAIRAVPVSLRHGSLALGATQWQTIWKVVLPSALPGILTGTILAMCRAMGEAAPLVLFGATMYIEQVPTLFSRFTVMPMQIFVWADRVSPDWRNNAALASFILMIVLLSLNALAIYLRQRSQAKTRY
jgi:phosphate transport system permease protein